MNQFLMIYHAGKQELLLINENNKFRMGIIISLQRFLSKFNLFKELLSFLLEEMFNEINLLAIILLFVVIGVQSGAVIIGKTRNIQN